MGVARAIAATPDRSGWLTLLAGAGLAAAALLLPGAVKAGEFSPPQGCTLNVTVQNRGCSVSQHYVCSGDTQGDMRTAIFGKDGLRYQSRIDAETRWMESINTINGIQDRLVENSKDHASFSTLEETGYDDFDFWTESSTGERLRNIGFDKLTGEKTTIDGVELEQTRFHLKTFNANGDLLIERSGNQFISREMGRFLGGTESMADWTGEKFESDDSPVLFAFPGEDGFGETVPQFDCDEMMARFERLSPEVQADAG
ncbi:hypothetical protein JJJ17_19085 [Paracoccus caeni]|uniref:Uncharacterized protein n=1 Tax=Paracoccus caeni TaxID=657651 RepID=A0A934SPG3_9RHOB|nr:hypothetical protein [Paracoccus caeni]MBK4218038.1 hypothetical protein [Paracoccus caeni]